ncbi:MAG TPA: FAD-binding protein [Gammaproteobacteria bacterium]|nr:putative FAD-linked oxidoreductase [bacterium BMS3Abin11]HDH09044.1 FAD-binding protein [Gammaproteobacteria bacterium]HDH15230.1 FAD-binding protein [Gammaproteobacteria bacterium]
MLPEESSEKSSKDPPKNLDDDFLILLKPCLSPERLLLDMAECWTYGFDNSRKHAAPQAVALPVTHDEVVAITTLCNRYKIPLTVRGRGTGTTGGSVPVQGGLVMSMEQMNRIIEVDVSNRLMRVEPGVTNQAVQDCAAENGFFWAPDPGSASVCTVGGNLGFNAAGPRAIKYSTTRENTLSLIAVTANGDTLHTGVKTTKGVTGYDLTRLLIGSEGTLAIITEATLKLLPLPQSSRTLTACYNSIQGATDAIVAIMNQSLIPTALEFLDQASIKLVKNKPGVHIPDDSAALLLIEVDGLETEMPNSIKQISSAASNASLLEIYHSDSADGAKKLWATRKALSPALRQIAPNKLNEDVVVPVANIPALLQGLQKLSEKYGIPIVNFGHAGNGNIHVNLLYDTQNAEQSLQAMPCLSAVFELVLGLDGTLSGEHGIGTEKKNYIALEIDQVTLNWMKKLKTLFDPNNILNPGKVFP